jgi:hypothetical protein
MGGVFNVVNLHLYHYAGNNPLKYTDPDGNHSEETIVFYWYVAPMLEDGGGLSLQYYGSYDAKDIYGNISRGNFIADSLPDGITLNYGLLGTTLVMDEDLSYIAKTMGATITPEHDVRLLRDNLKRQGENSPGRGYAAHHIVPGQDRRASDARNILSKYGIDPNHAENGVWLSPKDHTKTYSTKYIDWVNTLMNEADSLGKQQAVLDTLNYIKTNLKNGNFDF